MGSQLRLTVQDLDRARILAAQGWATREVLDQRQSEFNVAVATYHATEATIASATAGVEAATHNADLIEVNIADNTLTAPKHGPINGSPYVQQVILAEVQRTERDRPARCRHHDGPSGVQSQCDAGLVHERHRHHQQHHDAGHPAVRRRRHP